MAYGFIYLLSNPSMPCYYKVGCTERAPHARAEELSSSTAVPEPFEVLLYIELRNFQRHEQWLHGHLADFRANGQREFFVFGPQHLPWLYAVFRSHPAATAFTECGWAGDLESAIKYEDPWATDRDAPDGAILKCPSSPPIGFGELRLVA